VKAIYGEKILANHVFSKDWYTYYINSSQNSTVKGSIRKWAKDMKTFHQRVYADSE
jgi:hypothetical protein